jgi:hypothetical protein
LTRICTLLTITPEVQKEIACISEHFKGWTPEQLEGFCKIGEERIEDLL